MTRQLYAQQSEKSFVATQVAALAKGWTEKVLWTLLLLSVFGLVYLKFINRYHTIWLDQLERQQQVLMQEHDQLELKKEKLLTNSRVETDSAKKLSLHIPGHRDVQALRLPNVKA